MRHRPFPGPSDLETDKTNRSEDARRTLTYVLPSLLSALSPIACSPSCGPWRRVLRFFGPSRLEPRPCRHLLAIASPLLGSDSRSTTMRHAQTQASQRACEKKKCSDGPQPGAVYALRCVPLLAATLGRMATPIDPCLCLSLIPCLPLPAHRSSRRISSIWHWLVRTGLIGASSCSPRPVRCARF
jgi:hypothetical protein